jgi:DNA-binding PadR family transcriptional regulator
MPLDRLKRKMTKEVMWLYVLTLLKERPRYAYELKKEIEDRFNWSPATITSYVVLYRLKSGEYVKTQWGNEQANPRRKYYSITKKGEHLLKDGETFLREMINILFED